MPVTGVPPVTDEVLRVTLSTEAGNTVITVVFVVAPRVAVIVTGVFESTPEVVIPKVAELKPAFTIAVPETETAGLLELKLTTRPPAGAGPVRTTEALLGVLPPTI